MPVNPTFPGVYIEEIPSGIRTITGVATSIAAFIDYFPRGPMNRAVQLLSVSDFERQFGGLDTNSEASFAIQQFFLNGGSEAWAVRVGNSTDSATVAARKAQVTLNDAVGAGAASLTILAANEGTWGNNIRIDVTRTTTGSPPRFDLTATEVTTVNGRNVIQRQEVFRNLVTTAGDPNNAANIVNNSSLLIRIDASSMASAPADTGTLSGVITVPVNSAAPGVALQVHAKFQYGGTPPDEDADMSLGTPTIGSLAEAAARLQSALRSARSQSPAWAQAIVRVTADQRLQVIPGGAISNVIAQFSAPAGDTTNAAALLKLTSGAGASDNVAQYAVGATGAAVGAEVPVANGDGLNGNPPDGPAIIGSAAVDPPTGLFALDKVDLFNILCIPRIANVTGANPFPSSEVSAVINTATAYCDSRRAFFILDTPSNITNLQQMQTFVATLDPLRDQNSAFYFPRVQFGDPLNGFVLRSFGASGTLAGVYARIDANRGVWKAPAGTEAVLRGVSDLDYKLTDAENGTLNPIGINSVRVFPIYGFVSWGARTLEGADVQASDYKYVPVRRLALFLEESIFRALKTVVFEPNGEGLWSQIRLNVGVFLQSLFRQGAFAGLTPKDAYFVKVDSETTTQDDINRGIVNVIVGFAPLKPAEFVIIKLQQIAGQVSV